MKPENTSQNRAAFIAQYYGSPAIVISKLYNENRLSIPDGISDIWGQIDDYGSEDVDKFSIELRSIKNLTDEEAEYICEIEMAHPRHRSEKEHVLDEFLYNGLSHYSIDYLRSIGILAGWNELTDQDVLSYGWAVIR